MKYHENVAEDEISAEKRTLFGLLMSVLGSEKA